ncbi:hypothetical protein ASF88_17910 [Leifsonia sp. Leaf336]|uniref:hypothetical protein n=1 Tax=Leifsonia sp. Leaf336 TaxID=1736341 RepID=UPI0006FFA195|nr:hypothetical protein [Leifsonia sp. Leaf336]KQR51069.1 hypothetical protein ASF88_17910 [Leifsonia sp. Leaf336]
MTEDVPVLSDSLIEVFASGSWIFLPAAPARGLATELEAEILDEQFSWCENPHLGEGAGLLVLTSAINGWMLLHGASETVGWAAGLLSERRDVYRATIDVRLPAMSWAFLERGAPTRSVSVELGDDGDLVTRTSGHPLPFEADGIEVPNTGTGLDVFFYPVALLAEHGVTLHDLEVALDRPSVTLRVR